MKIRPLRDRVIVRRDPPNDKTPGGLYVPETARTKVTIGTVLAVGPGAFEQNGTRRPVDVKVGDRIVFGKYSGSEIAYEGENDQVQMSEEEILGHLIEE